MNIQAGHAYFILSRASCCSSTDPCNFTSTIRSFTDTCTPTFTTFYWSIYSCVHDQQSTASASSFGSSMSMSPPPKKSLSSETRKDVSRIGFNNARGFQVSACCCISLPHVVAQVRQPKALSATEGYRYQHSRKQNCRLVGCY